MEPDIRFFEAGAQIIPTLLIAIVFTARLVEVRQSQNEAPAQRTGRERFIRSLRLNLPAALLAFLGAVAVIGERAALIALLENRPTWQRAHVVYFAIGAEIILLGIGIFRPILMHLYEETKDSGRVRSLVGITVAFVAIVICIQVALVWPV